MMKKQRPRNHIIADLSINYVERLIFLCGYSVERVKYDYGYDLILFTYDEKGEIENGQVYLQVKATDSLKFGSDNKTILFCLKSSDLTLWLNEPMPCILIIYDALADCAYWLYLQAYFEALENFELSKIGDTITVYIPKTNILTQKNIGQFAKYKNNLLTQIRGVIKHELY